MALAALAMGQQQGLQAQGPPTCIRSSTIAIYFPSWTTSQSQDGTVFPHFETRPGPSGGSHVPHRPADFSHTKMLEARPRHLPILVNIPGPFQGLRLCSPSSGSPPSLVINPPTGEDRRPGPFPGRMAESKANHRASPECSAH